MYCHDIFTTNKFKSVIKDQNLMQKILFGKITFLSKNHKMFILKLIRYKKSFLKKNFIAISNKPFPYSKNNTNSISTFPVICYFDISTCVVE